MSRVIALLPFVVSMLFFSHAATAQDAVSEVEKIGGSVRKIAANVDWIEVDFHLSGTGLTDEGLVHVSKIDNVVWLHLKDTKITDAGLQHIAGMTGLTRLHLERTGIGDAGLAHLKGLTNLEYLNLYGTKVTDAGLAHLHGMKNLKKLYLWQSGVTADGAAALEKALPSAAINLGLEAKPVAVKGEDKPMPDKPKVAPPTKSLAKGQFVKVRLEGAGRILSLAEVQVFETNSGKELQREGKATQSSVSAEGEAARASDGNTKQVYTDNSVSHTEAEDNPWWQLDLGGVKDVGKIRVFNRGDCCGDRLADAIVEVLDASQKVVWSGKVEAAADGSKHDFVAK